MVRQRLGEGLKAQEHPCSGLCIGEHWRGWEMKQGARISRTRLSQLEQSTFTPSPLPTPFRACSPPSP